MRREDNANRGARRSMHVSSDRNASSRALTDNVVKYAIIGTHGYCDNCGQDWEVENGFTTKKVEERLFDVICPCCLEWTYVEARRVKSSEAGFPRSQKLRTQNCP